MKATCVIIPSFNVETTIAEVIHRISQFVDLADIIVVDDGSADRTGTAARKAGAIVLQNSINRGKGYSLKRGFCYAIENGYEAVITIDGDLQHNPDEIPKFLTSFYSTDADIILGDRTGDFSTMPRDRQFSNKMTSLVISILTGKRVRDSQSGYRLIKTDVLKKINLVSNRYETESELLVKSLLSGFKITHVPIRTIYNDGVSHIHRFKDTVRFVFVVLISLVRG